MDMRNKILKIIISSIKAVYFHMLDSIQIFRGVHIIPLVHIFGTPKIYTTTGFGPRKIREMAGVDDLVVYMQTAVKYSSLNIHRPRGGVYTNCCILQQFCIYTTRSSTPAVPLFFLGPNLVVVYISGVPIGYPNQKNENSVVCWKARGICGIHGYG